MSRSWAAVAGKTAGQPLAAPAPGPVPKRAAPAPALERSAPAPPPALERAAPAPTPAPVRGVGGGRSKKAVEGLVRSPVAIYDIGLNLKHKSFAQDLQDVLLNAASVNVTGFICTGTSLANSEHTIRQIARLRSVPALSGVSLYSTVGVHPHDAKTCNAKTISNMRTVIEKNRDIVVAVGECGLDFNRNFSDPDQQVLYFEEQVRLACELQLPLFTHERDAHEKFLEVLDKFASSDDQKDDEAGGFKLPKICVHCFTGTEDELDEYLRRGYYIGITGFVCKRKRGAGLLSYAAKIPKDKLMIETDSPFMAPEDSRLDAKYRNRNEPATLPVILERLAEAMGIDTEELGNAVTQNTKTFFNLDSVNSTEV
eukprot:TRINITY_DN4912_c0_g1_i1.p2 TRINITY_DN4912_c0_g1~~TRINITY_DN4912_c0_g1_i1.p2  ORF type:complete len:369 (+),score=120.83 TRINITY_DN4912_c0_g1_i1:1583-2689(+)